MQITAEMIKALRAETNAGVLDCRKALQESNGDHKKAVAWLKSNGPNQRKRYTTWRSNRSTP